ncbi:biotin--[acetyl-CoA-carboxylase] ligase [Chitinophaga sp. sic0106]|uniref:biotin--[acetyl-CoA-carboxylase] ligase n=1 Tax=Chitinophaga sp. sic0106 TaxID=2854785 RepID=UPI001C49304E|nr:biotin--[acetyl-CoA-carboxylase] ligase [Chitinophaga sp. sic0106]
MIGHPFYILEKTDSTNNYAMAQVNSGDVTSGTAWFTGYQTAGKGTRGKKWLSEPGDVSALSVALQPAALPLSRQFLLSAVAALATYDLFSTYAGDETAIKWPNDIYWRDRKAVGILIENVIRGTIWQYAIIGIGVNLNQAKFPEELRHAVSLRQITGKTWEGPAFAQELCACLDKRVRQLETGNYTAIMEEYKSRLFRLNIPASYRKDGVAFTGIIKDVLETGILVMEIDNARHEFTFGEIEFILS